MNEMAAIEAEWPLIEAEIVVLDCEIRILCADHFPTDLDVHRLLRAQRRVVCEAALLLIDALDAQAASKPAVSILWGGIPRSGKSVGFYADLDFGPVAA
jgi:hypothetical protein